MSLDKVIKVMLHETIHNTTNFSATQRCNIVANGCNVTLFQHWSAVLCQKSSFRIVSCNINLILRTSKGIVIFIDVHSLN